MEHDGWGAQYAEIGSGGCRLCCYACQAAKRLRVQQQHDGGENGYQEFYQHPIVPEQAPGSAKGLDKPR